MYNNLISEVFRTRRFRFIITKISQNEIYYLGSFILHKTFLCPCYQWLMTLRNGDFHKEWPFMWMEIYCFLFCDSSYIFNNKIEKKCVKMHLMIPVLQNGWFINQCNISNDVTKKNYLFSYFISIFLVHFLHDVHTLFSR